MSKSKHAQSEAARIKRGPLGVKVFSATKGDDRNNLGAVVTEWLQFHPSIELADAIVTQSSDSDFHCLTITLFYYRS